MAGEKSSLFRMVKERSKPQSILLSSFAVYSSLHDAVSVLLGLVFFGHFSSPFFCFLVVVVASLGAWLKEKKRKKSFCSNSESWGGRTGAGLTKLL